jgi:hypothetical protein
MMQHVFSLKDLWKSMASVCLVCSTATIEGFVLKRTLIDLPMVLRCLSASLVLARHVVANL